MAFRIAPIDFALMNLFFSRKTYGFLPFMFLSHHSVIERLVTLQRNSAETIISSCVLFRPLSWFHGWPYLCKIGDTVENQHSTSRTLQSLIPWSYGRTNQQRRTFNYNVKQSRKEPSWWLSSSYILCLIIKYKTSVFL